MKMKKRTLPRLLAFSAVAFVTGVALAPAPAYARGRSTVVNGPRGGHYQRQVSQSPGNFSASKSATLPNGKSASRNVTSQRIDTGRTTRAEATGFNGQSATYNSTTTRTETGFTRQANATGPQGGTASKQVTVVNENGVVNRTVTTAVTPNP
jgi:hypothetical protein